MPGRERRWPWRELAAVALALAAPCVLSPYLLGELTFVAIMAIGGLSLTVLTGWSGQVSLGQAAFVGIGAYIHALALNLGLPWPGALVLATAGGAVGGVVVGLPALRLSGLHLLVMTLAAGILVEQILGRWSSVTGGHQGLAVPAPSLPGLDGTDPRTLYLIAACSLLAVLKVVFNLMHHRIGRAWRGLRDSEAAAQALGVPIERSKLLAFVVSGSIAAMAGGLLAYQLQYITPEAFGLSLSLQLLVMVKVGGSNSPYGALVGAAVIGFLPTAVSAIKPLLPAAWSSRPGLETFFYGLLLFACVMWEGRTREGGAPGVFWRRSG
jgi:branched-chain amino acid transport system permease protein